MSKIKIEIKNRVTGKILFEYESENNTIGKTVTEAVKTGADLFGADLSGADLSGADLSGANLSGADLSGADLSGSNLSGADLFGANLSGADLSTIKNDLLAIIMPVKSEIAGLKKAIIEGRIDGSTYEGECACLVGTIANLKGCRVDNIEGVRRDLSRPAERWFLGIKKGDTPENNQIAKLSLEWIEEFEQYLK